MHKIIVVINGKGETEIKVEGVAGGGCLKATKDLEEALGKVTKDAKTGDFYKQAQAGTQINLGH